MEAADCLLSDRSRLFLPLQTYFFQLADIALNDTVRLGASGPDKDFWRKLVKRAQKEVKSTPIFACRLVMEYAESGGYVLDPQMLNPEPPNPGTKKTPKTPPFKPMSRPLIFVSYSHKDDVEKNSLLSQLGVLEKEELFDIWVDDRIGAGGDWETEIKLAIQQARVAILFVTANFLNSPFILRREVPHLLERFQSEGLLIYPVIAKPCAWDRIEWLKKINVRPKNGAPVWREGGRYADEELAAVAREIADIIFQSTQADQEIPHPSGLSTPMQTVSEARLLDAMKNSLDIADFKQLCFSLGVNDQNLPGQGLGLPVLLMELIGYHKRRGRYSQLVSEFLKMRPNKADELFKMA